MASIKIREVPEYAKPIVYAFGFATINWGKMEQALEMLLHSVNRDDYHIGYVEKFPTTSFRLKVNLFRDWFVEHPSFAEIHPVAKPVCAGLKKAITSRILMTHSAVIEFKPGPPATAEVNVARTRDGHCTISHGSWTEQDILEAGLLFGHLAETLVDIGRFTLEPTFRRSLERELSRIERASLWGHRLRRGLQRLCSRQFSY